VIPEDRIRVVTEFKTLPERALSTRAHGDSTPCLKEESMSTTTLSRPREGTVIAGVCAGLADRFGMSPFVVRLLFVLSCLLPGPQFLIYIGLWIFMPKRSY
jgi:phage shock protein C